jgi:pimeloyl-ACP methyl ester carboxylesterase
MTGAVGPLEEAVLAGLWGTAGARVDEAAGLRLLRAGSKIASGADRLRLADPIAGGAGPSEGPETVVLLHGRGHAASIWFPLLPELAARHPVLALDLPGFGASPGGAGDGLAFFVEPVEAALAEEVAAGRASSLALVGHSLGGLVALELALRTRLPVARLALIDAMGLGPRVTFGARCFFRLHPERLAARLGPRLFDRLNPAPRTPLGQRIAALEHELLVARPRERRAAARAFDRLCPLAGGAFHLGARLADVRAPTQILWGDRDRALPVANAEAARVVLPAAELARFPDLGHAPHLEAPERVLARLVPHLGPV